MRERERLREEEGGRDGKKAGFLKSNFPSLRTVVGRISNTGEEEEGKKALS